ncbi:uncharacterized protein PAC_15890 [Phialocephala subalpina]|uniref:Uncharacterized protein n=1 Tax=Phialocephala subalpina TaxID=576137 RepID=A0A1L7XLQ9_9HELO|nr:uncharacterized protein PAC_15890 [Phialocephala subalpina]
MTRADTFRGTIAEQRRSVQKSRGGNNLRVLSSLDNCFSINIPIERPDWAISCVSILKSHGAQALHPLAGPVSQADGTAMAPPTPISALSHRVWLYKPHDSGNLPPDDRLAHAFGVWSTTSTDDGSDVVLLLVPSTGQGLSVLVLAAGYDRKYAGRLSFAISLWSAVAALVLLLPIHGLYIRLARRFLLADNDARYEPTRPIRYRDNPGPTVSSPPKGQSCLHDAWTDSLETRQPAQTMPAQATPESQTPATGSETAANTAIMPESNTTPVIACPADHCPTTGYINAVPYSLRGYRAWLRYPLLYKPLAFYMTFLTWEMIAIIRAKKMEPQIKYDHPYRPLYLCLSGYTLCLYSWSNFIRRSTFAKREPKPPSSLIQIQRRLGPTLFFDPNTNEPMRVGNERMPDGLRIHPTQHNGLASQTTGEPLKSCQSHLGHLGHGFIASRRYIPVLCRTSIIFLIVLYYHKGERYLITDSNPELPEGLPLEELNRLMGKGLAIKGATIRFIWCNGPVRILVLIYGVHAVMELVYEQIVSLRSISGAAAEHVHDIVQQTEQAA